MSSLLHEDIFSKKHCDDCMAVKPQLATKHQEINVYLHIRLQKRVMIDIYKGI